MSQSIVARPTNLPAAPSGPVPAQAQRPAAKKPASGKKAPAKKPAPAKKASTPVLPKGPVTRAQVEALVPAAGHAMLAVLANGHGTGTSYAATSKGHVVVSVHGKGVAWCTSASAWLPVPVGGSQRVVWSAKTTAASKKALTGYVAGVVAARAKKAAKTA